MIRELYLILFNRPLNISWLDYIYALVVAVTTWLFGDVLTSMGILTFMVILDFISGVMRAAQTGKVDSCKMARSAYKLVAYIMLVSMVHVLFVNYFGHHAFIADSPNMILRMNTFGYLVSHVVCAILILREVNSVLENLVASGLIPNRLAAWLARIFIHIREDLERRDIEKHLLMEDNDDCLEI